MPRPIHPIPTAGKDLPLTGDLHFLSAIPGTNTLYIDENFLLASASSYAESTGAAALACSATGELLCRDKPTPIQPVCSLGSIAWPESGYDIQINQAGTVTKTSRNQAYTTAKSIGHREVADSKQDRELFIGLYVNSYNYNPRIWRTTSLSQALLNALPENSARAGTMPIIGGHTGKSEYFSATPNYYAYDEYVLEARRCQHTGTLLSFPLRGVSSVRLSIGYDLTLNGNSMHPDGSITVPLRACFVPVKGDARLTHWPTWPQTVEFDAELGDGYGSGLKPTLTLDLTTTLYKLVSKEFHSAEWDLPVPASGLGIFWVELDPFKYSNFAEKMIRTQFNSDHWQSLSFRAQITQAIALRPNN